MSEHRHGADHDDSEWRFDRAFWDEHYGSAPSLWSGRPNPVLVDEVSDLRVGRVLDVGCGEGADALWLAQQGWQVLGVDVSQVALDRAAAHLAAAGFADHVEFEQHNLMEWTPPPQSFDLVSAQFFQLPADVRTPVYDALAEAVVPGGTLLVVAHHPSDIHSTVGRPPAAEMFFTADELAERMDEAWDLLAVEARERATTDPDGHEVTITDTVLKARAR